MDGARSGWCAQPLSKLAERELLHASVTLTHPFRRTDPFYKHA